MSDIMMEFPKSWEQFVDDYKFVDKEQIYTNGSELIQVLRVKQMMQHYLPAADVQEVRHGRWVETIEPMGWDEVTCAECSVCGEDFVLDDWGMEDMKNLFLYCPNCGAKMDEEEDNDA